jgi:RNA binding exosome subunit
MTKAEQFVSVALLGRDLAQLAHWKTKSYAEHKALGEFYDGLLDLIDGFVEQYQGYYGKRMDIVRADDDQKDNIREVLEYQAEWIEMYRYQICERDESALQNTIDEILRLYQTTAYLLTLE